jgi:nucleoside 2-deoxyribosyltransferase
MRIYLAGGMHARPRASLEAALQAAAPFLGPADADWLIDCEELAWADLIQHLLPRGHEVFDPRDNQTKVFEEYSFLDLVALRQSDLVIACLEESNPSGAGLIAEVGFAKGLGKSVLLINEKQGDRYVRFVENFADLVFHDLPSAIPVISKIHP